MTDTQIIRLTTPLPCGVMREGNRCGRPAHVASATPVAMSEAPEPDNVVADLVARMYRGHWLILPVCEQCVRDLSERYQLEVSDEESATT